MSAAWVTILALAVATALIKASGPAALGGRPLPPRMIQVISLLAPALLAALVLVESFSHDGELAVDARTGGVAAAAVSLSLRRDVLLAVVVAAATTALLRAVA